MSLIIQRIKKAKFNLLKEALPISSKSSTQLTKTLAGLMQSSISLRMKSIPSGATNIGVRVRIFGDDNRKIGDFVYDLTAEVHRALSSTGYTGKTIKRDSDISRMKNIETIQVTPVLDLNNPKAKVFFSQNYLERMLKLKKEM